MFDGIPPDEFDPAIVKLDEVIGSLSDDVWIKYRSRDGHRRCLDAIVRDFEALELLEHPILRTAHEVTGIGFDCIPDFNDDAGTDFDRLMFVLRKTREHLVDGTIAAGPVVEVPPEPVFKRRRIMSRALATAAGLALFFCAVFARIA